MSIALPRTYAKEIRPLLPAWLGCAAMLLVVGPMDDPKLYVLALLASGLVTVALGALTIGHEYSHRTMSFLLAQPAPRWQAFLTKAAVLAPMLLALAALAWVVPFNRLAPYTNHTQPWQGWSAAMALVLPAMCALFLTPALTMACRSTLAGMVFTLLVPIFMGLTSELIAIGKYGLTPVNAPAADEFRITVFWWEMGVAWAVGAVASWLMFMRLEAIEGQGTDLHLRAAWRTRDASDAPTTRRHPMWMLIAKELRIQHMAFLVAGLYFLGWGTLVLIGVFVGDPAAQLIGPPIGVVAVMYSGLQALLIGSLASAEERQFGTLEWQTLLPVSTRRQWLVKAAMTLAVALALAAGWPALLAAFNPLPHDVLVTPLYAAAIVLLTTVSLYVSSLSSSGVKAFMVALPGAVGALSVFRFLASALDAGARRIAGRSVNVSLESVFALLIGLVALVLWLAMTNHRSAERSPKRVARQLLWMLAYLIAGMSGVYIMRGLMG